MKTYHQRLKATAGKAPTVIAREFRRDSKLRASVRIKLRWGIDPADWTRRALCFEKARWAWLKRARTFWGYVQ